MSFSGTVIVFDKAEGSIGYQRFLMCIGEQIELKSFPGFLGGLDNQKNLTGTHSVHTTWKEFEVMFHVSTLLPRTQNDVQNVEKKRHLGNGKFF
jgi:hypothetical protein